VCAVWLSLDHQQRGGALGSIITAQCPRCPATQGLSTNAPNLRLMRSKSAPHPCTTNHQRASIARAISRGGGTQHPRARAKASSRQTQGWQPAAAARGWPGCHKKREPHKRHKRSPMKPWPRGSLCASAAPSCTRRRCSRWTRRGRSAGCPSWGRPASSGWTAARCARCRQQTTSP